LGFCKVPGKILTAIIFLALNDKNAIMELAGKFVGNREPVPPVLILLKLVSA
jgi:hypothetical protein